MKLPKERNQLIEYRYNQLIEEYGEDMDLVQDMIEEYIRSIDRNSKHESATYFNIKNRISERDDRKIDEVPLTEDIAINMIGIDYVDIDDVTFDIIETMLTLKEREFKSLVIHFFDDQTFADTANYFDCSNMRAQQITAKALRKLRHPSRAKRLISDRIYYYDTNISYSEIIEDVINNLDKLYKFYRYCNSDMNIARLSKNDIKNEVNKIFGKSNNTSKHFINFFINKRKQALLNLQLDEEKENVSESDIDSRLEIGNLIVDLELKISKVLSYKHFPYKIYIKPIMEEIRKIAYNVKQGEEDKLKLFIYEFMNCLSEFKATTIDENINNLIYACKKLNIETTKVKFRNMKLEWLLEMVKSTIVSDRVLDSLKTTLDIPDFVTGDAPIAILLDSVYPKDTMRYSLSSFYKLFIKYVINGTLLTVPYIYKEYELEDAVVDKFEEICSDYVTKRDINEKIEKEKQRELEEQERKKREKELKLQKEREVEEANKLLKLKQELKKSIIDVRENGAEFTEEVVFNFIRYQALSDIYGTYNNFLELYESYTKNIIHEMFKRMKDNTLNTLYLNELDPFMVNAPWDELYYRFSNVPIFERRKFRIDVHYWIIIDTLIAIIDYYGYEM